MKVYRLEYRHNKQYGPFNPPAVDGFFSFNDDEVVRPARAANIVAKALGEPGPYRLRNIFHDGINVKVINRLAKAHGGQMFVHGFASMEQYHEWFTSPAQRKALFQDVTFTNQAEWNDLELREFDVPDDEVLIGKHQVGFYLEDATGSRAVSRAEAIA